MVPHGPKHDRAGHGSGPFYPPDLDIPSGLPCSFLNKLIEALLASCGFCNVSGYPFRTWSSLKYKFRTLPTTTTAGDLLFTTSLWITFPRIQTPRLPGRIPTHPRERPALPDCRFHNPWDYIPCWRCHRCSSLHRSFDGNSPEGRQAGIVSFSDDPAEEPARNGPVAALHGPGFS